MKKNWPDLLIGSQRLFLNLKMPLLTEHSMQVSLSPWDGDYKFAINGTVAEWLMQSESGSNHRMTRNMAYTASTWLQRYPSAAKFERPGHDKSHEVTEDSSTVTNDVIRPQAVTAWGVVSESSSTSNKSLSESDEGGEDDGSKARDFDGYDHDHVAGHGIAENRIEARQRAEKIQRLNKLTRHFEILVKSELEELMEFGNCPLSTRHKKRCPAPQENEETSESSAQNTIDVRPQSDVIVMLAARRLAF